MSSSSCRELDSRLRSQRTGSRSLKLAWRRESRRKKEKKSPRHALSLPDAVNDVAIVTVVQASVLVDAWRRVVGWWHTCMGEKKGRRQLGGQRTASLAWETSAARDRKWHNNRGAGAPVRPYAYRPSSACACRADPVHASDPADRSASQRPLLPRVWFPSGLLVAAEHPRFARPPLASALALPAPTRPELCSPCESATMSASTSTASSSRSPRRRSPLARAARAALALAVASTAISAVNAAMYEPPAGQVMLGFWFDPADRESGPVTRPAAAASRAIARASPVTEDGRATGATRVARSARAETAMKYRVCRSDTPIATCFGRCVAQRGRGHVAADAGFTGLPDPGVEEPGPARRLGLWLRRSRASARHISNTYD